MESNLFLICPDCYLEGPIRRDFEGKHFFLSVLGGVIEKNDFSLLASILEFVEVEKVKNINIINSTACNFLRAAVEKKEGYRSPAEKHFKDLLNWEKSGFEGMRDVKEYCLELGKKNILYQVDLIHDISFLREKIQDHQVKVNGYLYDHDLGRFALVRHEAAAM